MKSIAITALKGGVGKTTITANLGVALAERGHRVTLIDMEPSANLTTLFGYGIDELGDTAVDVLRGEATIDAARLDARPRFSEPLTHKQKNLQAAWAKRDIGIVPSEMNLQGVNNELIIKPRGEDALRRALQAEVDAGRDPGIVLIDCQPGASQLTINAIAAAGNVLIPVFPHAQFSIDGVAQIADVTAGLNDVGIPVQVIGVLRTHVRNTDAEYAEGMAQLGDLDPLLETEIPRTQKFDNMQNLQQPFLYAMPDDPASQRYRDVAKEIEERLEVTS